MFGYSPTIGIRFVGEGNLTFSQLAAAAVLFAGLLVWQVPTRAAGVRSPVGGARGDRRRDGRAGLGERLRRRPLRAPGFALLGWMLLGHRVRVRTVAAIASIVVAAVVAVGLLDLLRSPDQRTHAGKFFQKVGTDFDGATLVIRRKAAANLSVLGHSVLLGAIIATALLVAYLGYVKPLHAAARRGAIPTAGATVLAFLVVMVLGFALNDSGIAIPGMMSAVFESAVVVLVGARYLARAPIGDP